MWPLVWSGGCSINWPLNVREKSLKRWRFISRWQDFYGCWFIVASFIGMLSDHLSYLCIRQESWNNRTLLTFKLFKVPKFNTQGVTNKLKVQEMFCLPVQKIIAHFKQICFLLPCNWELLLLWLALILKYRRQPNFFFINTDDKKDSFSPLGLFQTWVWHWFRF